MNFLGSRPFYYSDAPSRADLAVYSMFNRLPDITATDLGEAIARRSSLGEHLARVEQGDRPDDRVSPTRAAGASGKSGWQAVYTVVRRIPKGRVATYGQVAALAGMPRAARQVGYALSALESGARVPWQRVVNARGEVSERSAGHGDLVQRALLEGEGVVFDESGRIPLTRFQWKPRGARI